VFEHVSSNSFSELSRAFEDGGPVLELLNITLDAFAGVEVSGELSDNLTEGGNTSHDVSHSTLFEVIDDLLDFSGELVSVLKALLDLREVILLNDTVHKSGNNVDGVLGAKSHSG
jgi:hypothetical protein